MPDGNQVVDKYNMDGHKLYWHLDRVSEWKNGERVAPLHLDMGITTGCNMACTFCYGVIQGRSGFGTDKKGRYSLPTEVVKRSFSDAKEVGVRSIALIGEGENTLHPDFHDIVAFGRDIDLDLSLATNAVRIDHNQLDVLLSSLKWLRVNISAGEKEAFEKIHQVPQYDRVLKNIAALTNAKKKHGHPCTIGLQMVVTHENMDQIVPLAKLGAELGADYLVVKACSDTPDQTLNSPQGEYMDKVGLFKEAESFATDDYTVSIKWEKLANGGYKDYDVCFGTEFILGISGNGNVFPCGHWFDVRSDEFLMGNLIESSFKEIVESERYWEVQQRVKRVNVNRECESNCRQHYINRFLWQLSNDPPHMNFI